jgi:hypothetical protein
VGTIARRKPSTKIFDFPRTPVQTGRSKQNAAMKTLILSTAALVCGVVVGVAFANWVLAILQDYDDDVWGEDEDWY